MSEFMLLFSSNFSSLVQKRYSVLLLKRLDHGVKWLRWTQVPKVRTPNPSSERRSGARCRVRTCSIAAEHQAVTLADTHIDSQKIRDSSELVEIIRTWAQLAPALKAGVLAIVRSGRKREK